MGMGRHLLRAGNKLLVRRSELKVMKNSDPHGT